MKTLVLMLISVLAGFAQRALGCPAEFGEQQCYPAVTAASDLRSYQYRIVRFSAAQTCNVASNAVSAAGAQLPAGVLQNNPNSGEAASIAYAGLSKVWAGATTTARAVLTTNGSGQAIDAVSGDIVVGRFLEAGASDDRVSALLAFPVRWGSVA